MLSIIKGKLYFKLPVSNDEEPLNLLYQSRKLCAKLGINARNTLT